MDWIQGISLVGFPVVMCLWFMLKMEKIINNNSSVINNNTIALTRVEKVLEQKLK